MILETSFLVYDSPYLSDNCWADDFMLLRGTYMDFKLRI